MSQDSTLNTPLTAALINALPTMVNDPFSTSPRLNIAKFRRGVGKSHETVYRWLRENTLRRQKNIDSVLRQVNSDDNIAALKRLGRKVPSQKDFAPFLSA